ncbi:MAG: hypothetical protein K6U14_04620 [Firmicutes bacterium]|nr:hypothetical protein [Alicyclobacillaceae bacterium]MCL6496904.1 hypothetical protein [Bacillota bacterium]
MAYLAWRLGAIAEPTVLAAAGGSTDYAVVRGDTVWDVGEALWDRGGRPGQAFAALKWYGGEPRLLAWRASCYQAVEEALRVWLEDQARRFALESTAGMAGWGEWPEADTPSAWGSVLEALVPRWARRIQGGVASHPLLARWARDEGGAHRLPHWTLAGGVIYAVPWQQEAAWWAKLPLRYVEDPPAAWRRRGWKRVGDVPGLMEQLRCLPPAGEKGEAPVRARWDRELVAGEERWEGVLEYFGQRLISLLAERRGGVLRLAVEWQGEAGQRLRRERRWPEAAAEPRRVKARLVDLLQLLPPWPAAAVAVEAEVGPIAVRQMRWWGPDLRPAAAGMGTDGALDRQEVLRGYWDPWRAVRRGKGRE